MKSDQDSKTFEGIFKIKIDANRFAERYFG